MLVTVVGFPLLSAGSDVMAQAVPSLSITAPSDISAWALAPDGSQPKTQSGTLSVTTTSADGKSWCVAVSDNNSVTNGRMTKHDGASYVSGTKLGTPMQVVGPAGTVTLPLGGPVITGSGNVTSANYIITFSQRVLWSDAVITGPSSYRLSVTFSGSIQP